MEISPSTKHVGLIGHPVAHSASPRLHNRLYQELGMDMVYSAFDISPNNLYYGVKGLAALGFIGFNVTIPYKEMILEYIDELDPKAKAIGAVNTVKININRLSGYNTDGQGFMEALTRSGICVKDKDIMLIGAGGSARAISVYLAKEKPKKIKIYNRSPERAVQLSDTVNVYMGKKIAEPLKEIDPDSHIIINTTPAGMWPDVDENPLSGIGLKGNEVVCDIVYNPHTTSMLKYALEKGCTVIYGIDMLIGQGLRSAEIWTGGKFSGERPWNIMFEAAKQY